MHRWTVLLGILPVLLAGCEVAEAYRNSGETVLYDSTVPPARGSEERAAEADADPLAIDVDPAAAAPAVMDDNLARIFLLENAVDELRRAADDGAGERDRLLRKVQLLEREIEWRKSEAGDGYARARDLRLDQLLELEVVLK